MDYQRLSKEMSYALRHAPHEYELELDEYGWVEIEQLISSLQEQPVCIHISEQDFHTVIERSDKKRHEIKDGKIRALYGHSTPKKIVKEEKAPPDLLYHGTPQRFVASILANGLKPKSRQYVHLSEEKDTALQVGKRRDASPAILTIDAKRAYEDGVKFYHGNEMVWLADEIDQKYISVTANG